jgi:hypothetical protein
MKCLRIFATADGESHFDEVDIPTPNGPTLPGLGRFEISADYPASRLHFIHVPAGMPEVGWHTVPERVLTVRLNGGAEYQTSDGAVRYVRAGALVLVEDTHGKGHITRHSGQEQTVLWIALPDGLDLPNSPIRR